MLADVLDEIRRVRGGAGETVGRQKTMCGARPAAGDLVAHADSFGWDLSQRSRWQALCRTLDPSDLECNPSEEGAFSMARSSFQVGRVLLCDQTTRSRILVNGLDRVAASGGTR